jgi:uncharacterized OB-fold protein
MSDTYIKITAASVRPGHNVCPACGRQTLMTWYEGSVSDVGDVEPRAACTSIYCVFEY